MLARRFRAFCSDESYLGSARLERRLGVVERLLRDERALEELVGALEGPRRLCELGVRLLDVRGLLDVRQVLRIGRAVLCERPRQRCLLLVEAVLLLLVIELDQDLPCFDAIAEVGEDAADRAVRLRRDDHLIDGGQRPDDVHRSADRILLDDGGGDGLCRAFACCWLARFESSSSR